MTVAVASMLFFTLALVFCVACCAFIAVGTYWVVTLWRERQVRQDSPPRSSVRNPAGRAHPRTIRVSLGGAERLAVLQRENPNAADDAGTTRASIARLVPRSLADAVAQTSFILLNGVSSRSGLPDPARSSPRANGCSSSAPRPEESDFSEAHGQPRASSAPPAIVPGPSTSRANVHGSSALHATRRLAPRISLPFSKVGSSSRSIGPLADSGSTSTSHTYGLLSEGTLIKRHVRKNTHRAKAGDGAERSQTVTIYYQPAHLSEEPIRTPPDLSNDANLAPGDLFYHRMRDDRFQLWLWCIGVDGQPWWKPVYEGYEREDGKWLLITPQLKVPGWRFRHRPLPYVRRTYSLAYAYSATATAKAEVPTYLVFPTPAVPRPMPASVPTMLRDFTKEVSGSDDRWSISSNPHSFDLTYTARTAKVEIFITIGVVIQPRQPPSRESLTSTDEQEPFAG
ncbi:hypothetical protein GSI_10048 [Ganoderma sinense ZZ0214-1]|uniref:Uncharacterized protein n=1 Tax=Ganoderma sinense ZZ0214-1 TaxID=1077348 RepID=A0A2G8RZH2_9APHY|nr:hypothetical protein GSI_10048 [Ganoderma sinense ZZ0214-1]